MSQAVAMEEVTDFRQRARAWIRENLPHVGRVSLSVRRAQTDEEELGFFPVARGAVHQFARQAAAGEDALSVF